MIFTTRSAVAAGAGLTAAALVAALGTATASAAAPAPTTTNRVQAAAGWLAGQFENSSHLPAPNGYKFTNKYGSSFYPNQGENSDAIFGLAAAKAGSSKVRLALTYLHQQAKAYADTSGAQGGPYDGALGKLAVTAEVTNSTLTDFGGVNLLQTLKSDECTATSDSCTAGEARNIFASISESFVLLAEARAGGSDAPSTAATTYFASLQCASGGFTGGTTACGSGAADVDSTSYAIMAMQAMGTTGAQLTDAVSWLRGQQNAAGYWVEQGIANTNSTGLATAALQGVGARYGKARTWLLSQQDGPGAQGGALRYDAKRTATTVLATSPLVLATAQGLTGLVDGASLATLTWKGSTAGVRYFAPTASASYTEHPGHRYTVTGGGFAPGERVTVTREGKHNATATADASGAISATFTLSTRAGHGYSAYTLAGGSSGLTATHRIHITA